MAPYEWGIYDADGDDLCDLVRRVSRPARADRDNAELIVRSVNVHDELLEALRDMVTMVRRLCGSDGNTETMGRAEAAIAKAEGKNS